MYQKLTKVYKLKQLSMMRKYIGRLIAAMLVLSVSLLMSLSHAETGKAHHLPAQSTNQDILGTIQTLIGQQALLYGDFSQRVLQRKVDTEEYELISESNGWLALDKPRRFRWEETQPFHQTTLLEGKKFTQFDPDLEQVIIRTISEQESLLPNFLLGRNQDFLRNNFKVISQSHTLAADTSKEPQLNGQIDLQSLDSAYLIQKISVVFKDSQISSVLVLDDSDSSTEIQFLWRELPRDVSEWEQLFELNIPESAEVVEQL